MSGEFLRSGSLDVPFGAILPVLRWEGLHSALGPLFITPYTPEQNGVIERLLRSLKEECVWQHNFVSFQDARGHVRKWIEWYNAERPHQALGYLSLRQYHAQQSRLVA